MLVNDFLLVACIEDFIENAHLFIFETSCCIQQFISINMTAEKTERWIVNLIRNARLEAKIDSKLGHVIKGNNAVSPYQQEIEKKRPKAFHLEGRCCP